MGQALGEAILKGKERVEDYILQRPGLFRRSLKAIREDWAGREGRQRAGLAATRAWRRVPAYRRFLAEHGLGRPPGSFEDLPVMSKDNYIRAYSTEERCLGGSYVAAGVAIDESSGSTGRPYNWVRGIRERTRMRFEMARMLGWTYGERPRIAINAFSMGAWATGVNVGEALEIHSVVKSTGPDLEKICQTFEFFGKGPGYFVCGYPPFLKLLADTLRGRGFALDEYDLHALVGGEGMGESLRRYLLRDFRTCYSGYGASDLAMGIALETAEAVRVRSLLHERPEVREALLEGDHRVPMVFQYNPITSYMETNAERELIVTLNYSHVLSPRVRYNIGDEARLMSRGELLATLRGIGHPVESGENDALSLPYLLLFGRRDSTISIMGANIYTSDIEQVLYGLPEVCCGLASFMIRATDGPDGSSRPRLDVEWTQVTPPELPLAEIADKIGLELEALNSDFRNAKSEYAEALHFEFAVHGRGQGPFAGDSGRIKHRYLGGTV
jgi:phenylacetate-coenzyme A ligase PaaK-like adenylate-forming protein